jgi:hypothetical protein
MSISRFINKVYNVDELFGEVEHAVAYLVDPTLSDDEDDRPEALLRLLFLMSETDDAQRDYIIERAKVYAFQYMPQYERAVKDYLRALTGKGKKKRRAAKGGAKDASEE